jgi:hypothetical protein
LNVHLVVKTIKKYKVGVKSMEIWKRKENKQIEREYKAAFPCEASPKIRK